MDRSDTYRSLTAAAATATAAKYLISASFKILIINMAVTCGGPRYVGQWNINSSDLLDGIR